MTGSQPFPPLPTPARRGVRVRVRGTVQGVGFRPYVYRLASALHLAGNVRNDDQGVEIEIEGQPDGVDAFLTRLPADAPPLARIDSVEVIEAIPRGRSSFLIADSGPGHVATPVTPDAATCDACLRELFDPADRRFRYPFINCTDCGPRFTIVTGTPYDRPFTTMAAFQMCEPCRSEYEDPWSRRFHAQPNACPTCGPALGYAVVAGGAGDTLGARGTDLVAMAAALLRRGGIIAVKGIGGYHLACRGDDDEVVGRLRRAKRREEKPFALMVRDLAAAAALAEIGVDAARLFASPERPIVLCRRRPDAQVAASVVPGARHLGLMLPYSPLHHLLLADIAGNGDAIPLVMTSGNVSDEPIAHEDEDAAARLSAIADAFLIHDRPIHIRTDDSVAMIAAGGPMLLRRSRGWVPRSLELPAVAPPLLACGAQLKSTFCLTDGRRAFVSHHIGDLEKLETFTSFTTGIDHFLRLFRVAPSLIVHDLHPEYLSTKYALDRAAEWAVPTIGAQHHHAHMAACLAEHGESGPALGVIYDGTGYGSDGTVWGGEFLLGDFRSFTRVGHLRTVRLPGGEAAIREPWRMACAWLCALADAEVDAAVGSAPGGTPNTDMPNMPRTLRGHVDHAWWQAVARLARTGMASPVTSSMGRLFDAVSALCGIRTTVSYEGQAAIELERAADPDERGAYDMPAVPGVNGIVLDPAPALRAVLAELASGVPVATIAARFHNTVAQNTVKVCETLCGEYGIGTVALSGGVFQNVLLLERVAEGLQAAGLRTLIPRRVPPNDGGISFGQAVIAAARSV